MASFQTQSQHENGLKKKKVPISNTRKYGFIISAVIYFVVTLAIVYRHKEKRKIFFNLFSDKGFLIGILGVIGFIVYTFNLVEKTDEIERIKTATKNAIVALLIAIMATLDLQIAPFWLIWLTSYYLDVSN